VDGLIDLSPKVAVIPKALSVSDEVCLIYLFQATSIPFQLDHAGLKDTDGELDFFVNRY
jgi:hypothetical protein